MFEGILTAVLGLVLLFAGKRFFWLAAGLAAFLFTWFIFDVLFGGGWVGLLISLVAAVIFGWLAVRFIRLIGYVVGFFAGFFILPNVLGFFGMSFFMDWLILGVFGGVIGVIAVAFAFDWGLILLTAFMGATAIGNGLQRWLSLSDILASVITLVLLVAGAIYQSRQMRS